MTQTIKIAMNKKLDPSFKPSMKTLSRLLRTMLENGPKTKTNLSVNAKLNYSRLAKHIAWLEKKGLVESKINKSKIYVGLTQKGRIFTSTLSDDQ